MDLDCKNGVDGSDSLAQLQQRIAFSTDTVSQLTPSGGLHLIYRANGHAVRNSAGKLGPGLDIRAEGGYILVSPSVLPAGAYAWADSAGPDDMDSLLFPAVLAELLAEPLLQPAVSQDAAGEMVEQSNRIDAAPGGQAAEFSEESRRALRLCGEVKFANSITSGGNGSPDARAALEGEEDKVRAAAKGTRNNTLNNAALALGELVAAGMLDRAEVEETLLRARSFLACPSRRRSAPSTAESAPASSSPAPFRNPQWRPPPWRLGRRPIMP